jgi:uncharacterized protein
MFDLESVKEFIRNSSEETSIYIGADSERYVKGDTWYADYTVAVVVHKDSSRGCRVFGKVDTQRDYDNRHDRPAMRLMNEVYRAAQMYLDLIDAIGDRHCEVHLDINPDELHGSNCVIQQATGYIRGMCGFTPKVKPEAFSASYAADRFKQLA